MYKKILYLGVLLLTFSIVLGAETTVSGVIYQDTVWTQNNSPVVIDGLVNVEPGVTLLVEEGVVIKFKNQQSALSVSGRLDIQGTSQNPVTLTSFKDDSAGGDTNADGFATSPSPGDWSPITFNFGSQGTFVNAKIFYGGGDGAVRNSGGDVMFTNSLLSYNRIGAIEQTQGTTTVINSTISNQAVGIYLLDSRGVLTVDGSLFENNTNSGIAGNLAKYVSVTNSFFSGNGMPAYVGANIDFVHTGNVAADNNINGWERSGTITKDTSWGPGDLLYVITNLGINPGTTLTLLPGTIIKLTNDGAFSVNGSFHSLGIANNKVYITSIKDDSIGGDTNNNGQASSPSPRDWYLFFFSPGSQGKFDETVVRYGGRNVFLQQNSSPIFNRGNLVIRNSVFEHGPEQALWQDAGSFDVASSSFSNYNTGIYLQGGTGVAHGNSFFNIAYYGIDNKSASVVDARDNWWGDASGPFHPTLNATGTGISVSNNVDFVPWLGYDPFSSTTPALTPVIIIPGIIGTELYNGNDLIWPDLAEMFNDVNDNFLTDNLSLDPGGDSLVSTIENGHVIDEVRFVIPIVNKEIQVLIPFKPLINSLTTVGYVINETYFTFPYDWRLDLDETVKLLNQKIEEVKTQTGSGKVDMIAHSMGGLLVKDYLSEHGKGSIDKLIFVGTPHLGAPKAGKVLLEGDRFNIPFLEEDRIKEIAENSPALHELLPTQTYFNEFQGYLRKYKLLGTNPLMNFEETKNYFITERNKNPVMFDIADDFYNKNLDSFDFSDIDAYNIAGCKTSTQTAYSFGLFDEIGQVGYTSGDGTVPLISANYINISSQNKFYVKDGNHAELPSTSGVRELVLEILNGNVVNLANNVSRDQSFCNFKGKKLTWHSPVEVHIYSDNNHTGPIKNNAIEYGISGIDYDVIGHNKFIFLPTDEGQEYQIMANGLEEGSFDLGISEVENGEYISTQIFNDVPITASTVISFAVDDSTKHNFIEVKNEEMIESIEAVSVLEGDLLEDLIPPETRINLDGKEYKDGEFKKEVSVSFIAEDDRSGILGTWYSLDGQNFYEYTSKFTLGENGVFTINYYSVDMAGNNEDTKQVQIIIGKLDKYLRKLDRDI